MIRVENRLPTQFFGSVATQSHIAIAYQSDARDISLCPETELQVCFLGMSLIAERTNPNHPIAVKLYESDTQSGSRVDDVVAAGNHFVFALNEGIYVGDAQKNTLIITDTAGQIERTVDLRQPNARIVQTALSSYQNNQIVICRGIEPNDSHQQLFPRIVCEFYDIQNAKRTTAATIQSDEPVRTLAVTSNGKHSLISWAEGGKMYAADLTNTDQKIELGASTATRPLIAAGVDAFAVAWQSDNGMTRIDRIPFAGEGHQTMELNGVDYRNLGGLAAVSEGYLSTFTHKNTQQVLLVSPDFEHWDLVENNSNARLFMDYASLDITEAHTGKILWQTAETLVAPK